MPTFYTRYQILFYLWQIGLVLKNYKVPKSYYQDFLKIFVLISPLPTMIKFLQKVLILAQKL